MQQAFASEPLFVNDGALSLWAEKFVRTLQSSPSANYKAKLPGAAFDFASPDATLLDESALLFNSPSSVGEYDMLAPQRGFDPLSGGAGLAFGDNVAPRAAPPTRNVPPISAGSSPSTSGSEKDRRKRKKTDDSLERNEDVPTHLLKARQRAERCRARLADAVGRISNYVPEATSKDRATIIMEAADLLQQQHDELARLREELSALKLAQAQAPALAQEQLSHSASQPSLHSSMSSPDDFFSDASDLASAGPPFHDEEGPVSVMTLSDDGPSRRADSAVLLSTTGQHVSREAVLQQPVSLSDRVLGAAPLPMVVSTMDGTIVQTNQIFKHWTLWTEEKGTIFQYIPFELLPVLFRFIYRATTGPEKGGSMRFADIDSVVSKPHGFCVRKKDQSLFWFRPSCSFLYSEAGTASHMITMMVPDRDEQLPLPVIAARLMEHADKIEATTGSCL